MKTVASSNSKNKKVVRCAALGASGYSGMELLRILAGHPNAEVVVATSNTYAGKRVVDVFPWAPVDAGLKFVRHDKGAGADADVFFTAFPHGQCFPHISKLLKRGRVVDLSADFRLNSAAGYDRWYDYTHPMPELLKKSVYGLSEIYRKKIKGAELVANPGCYPTSVILGMLPLAGMAGVDASRIIVDAKSGYSGAGRSLKPNLLFSEGAGEFTAYKVTGHSHTGEMQQELSLAMGGAVGVCFTPQLMPVSRGILSVMYVPVSGAVDVKKLRKLFVDRYADEAFVKVAQEGVSPSVKQVNGTNLCLVNVFYDADNGIIKVISAIDNLIKGAAGQAVQNMNIMFGLPEGEGLSASPILP